MEGRKQFLVQLKVKDSCPLRPYCPFANFKDIRDIRDKRDIREKLDKYSLMKLEFLHHFCLFSSIAYHEMLRYNKQTGIKITL
jgi:hypothetical protein